MTEKAQDPQAVMRGLVEGLRAHGRAYRSVERRFGTDMGLHSTDATALVEIMEAQEAGRPLTQSELGQRVGLTAGATSSLLNRLEDQGHIERVRSRVDRRVVSLRATQETEAMVERFFRPLGERVGSVMSSFSPAVLAEVERFLVDVTTVMGDFVEDPDA